ncbi:hypothetical protein B0H14DRAFT_3890167 [Mycena olivaceomarginata]|nr:hypothetical protein B0H14DRAFT_3890167 [Mycena olivaceomarginata]
MRSLRLRRGIRRGDSSSDFLDDLELPALERLALNCDTISPAASLLHRSASPLESLEFRFEDSDRSRTCISRIYNSVRDDKRDASDMFRQLMHSPGSPVLSLLPRLKHLEITRFEIDASFVRMAESRCARAHSVSGIQVPESYADDDVARLESLSVTELSDDTDPALLFRLRKLEVQSGLKLTIHLHDSDAPTRHFLHNRLIAP